MPEPICTGCGDVRHRTRFQEESNLDSKLCESCFIAKCPHPGGVIVPKQFGREMCARCGVVL